MFSFHSTGIQSIDPRLQYHLMRKAVMSESVRFTSADEGYIPVIAKVTDLDAWKNLSEVQPGVEIPHGNEEKGKYIVTGRVPLSRIEAIRALSFVESLKATQPIRPALKATLTDFGLTPETRTIGNVTVSDLQAHSKDVIVGIVDYGCDFAHKNFIDSNGKTRIARIWDQTKGMNPHSPNGYGKEYTEDKINAALATDDPYATLGYDPIQEDGDPAHGTHVMDIAAGNGSVDSDNHQNSRGVASQAKIVFVELGSDSPSTISQIMETDFGDSVRLVEAVKYIFDYANSVDKPCVINLSLGTNGGAHDGKSLVEKAFDDLVLAQDNRAIVIAASNSYADNIHKLGQVAQGSYSDVSWNIPILDRTSNEIEIWYNGRDEFALEVLSKDGVSVARVPLGGNGFVAETINGEERVVCFISHRANDSSNHDNVIHLFERPKLQNSLGNWTLRLHGVRVTNGNYHAWVERDNFRYQSNIIQADLSHTLGSISTGNYSVVVGSYDAHKATRPLSYFSSAGPTRDGRNKPEVSAPGHDVWAASSRTTDQLTRMSGTSMAAPAVTGLIALMFGLAKHLEKSMSISTTLQILKAAARKTYNEGNDWHSRYGYGMASGKVFSNSFFARRPITAGAGAVTSSIPAFRLDEQPLDGSMSAFSDDGIDNDGDDKVTDVDNAAANPPANPPAKPSESTRLSSPGRR